jgi:hypothetical protein
VRHGHFKTYVKDLARRSQRLIKKFEKYRKRAKQFFISEFGAECYQAKRSEWQAFVRWLRIHFCQCLCLLRHKHPRITFLRKQVATFVEWTRAELQDRGDKIPPQPELRRLVRQALRYVRRARRGFKVSHLLNNKVFASAHFANYVNLSLEKQRQKGTQHAI